MILGPQYQENN